MAPRLSIGILPDPETAPMWPHLVSLLEPAARLGGHDVLSPGELVWFVWNGVEVPAAATTRMTVCGTAEIILCGGHGARDWAQPLADKVAAWATDEGASAVNIFGRRGWARLIDWPIVEEREGLAKFEKVLA